MQAEAGRLARYRSEPRHEPSKHHRYLPAHVLALNCLAQLQDTIATVPDSLNENLEVLGIVPCRLDARTRHGPEVVAGMRKRFPAETFATAIRENVRLAEAPSFGQPITT